MRARILFRIVWIFLGFVSFLPFTFAGGGWVSTGGGLLKDAHNPWFIQNTSVVNYCVQVDSLGFSRAPAEVNRLILAAIKYWKKQFVLIDSLLNARYMVRVATQDFKQVDCTGLEDLRFQFGYGTLTAEQIAYLKDPNEYLGIAVRTSYDEVNLRGKGFIFIASDQGPHRYDTSFGEVENAWQYDGLLYRILAHELGHVFGIPHLSSGIYDTYLGSHASTFVDVGLMSQDYAESIIKKGLYSMYSQVDDLGDFFIPRKFQAYAVSKDAISFLGLQADSVGIQKGEICIRGKVSIFQNPLKGITIDLAVCPSGKGLFTPFGKVILSLDEEMVSRVSSVILVYVTSKQKVFPPIDFSYGQNIFGPSIIRLESTGVFQDKSGNQKSIFVKIGPREFSLMGIIDNKIHGIVE